MLLFPIKAIENQVRTPNTNYFVIHYPLTRLTISLLYIFLDICIYGFCFQTQACFLRSQSLSVNQVIKGLMGTIKRNSLSEEVHSKFILYHDKHVLSISTKFKSLEFSYEAGQVRSGHLIVSAEFIFYEVL